MDGVHCDREFPFSSVLLLGLFTLMVDYGLIDLANGRTLLSSKSRVNTGAVPSMSPKS
jgi:hypothetical protein